MQREIVHNYPMISAAMDRGIMPQWLKQGTLVKSIGTDGRKLGSIRPFPGFLNVESTGLTNATFFRYVVLRKGDTNYKFRGFLINSANTLTFYYYDTENEEWDSYEIGEVDPTAQIDCTVNSKFLYITATSTEDYPLVVWYGQDPEDDPGVMIWKQATMGYGDELEPDAWTGGTLASTGGYLRDGTYTIAYKFLDSERGVTSGMSKRFRVYAQTEGINENTGNPIWETKTALFTPTGVTAPETGTWDKVELYRTLCLEVVGSPSVGGLLYKESTIDIDDLASATLGTCPDEVLCTEFPYDPYWCRAGLPPNGGAIASINTQTIMAGDTWDGLAWSPMTRDIPESFPPGFAYVTNPDEGPFQRILQIGGNIFAIGRSVIYKLSPLGVGMGVDRLHRGYGLVSQDGVVIIGEDMLYATPLGIGLFDSVDGTFTIMTAVDRLVQDEGWGSVLHELKAAGDAAMGAAFFISPTKKEAIVVWYVNQIITMLKDINFVGATEGPELSTGVNLRAYFITPDGVVMTPDAYQERDTFTLFEMPCDPFYTVAEVSDTSTTVIHDPTSATSFEGSMGSKVYVGTESRTISSVENAPYAYNYVTVLDKPASFTKVVLTTGGVTYNHWFMTPEEAAVFSFGAHDYYTDNTGSVEAISATLNANLGDPLYEIALVEWDEVSRSKVSTTTAGANGNTLISITSTTPAVVVSQKYKFGSYIVLDTPLTTTPAVGSMASISPIYFEIVMPPIPTGTGGDVSFDRKRIKSIGLKMHNLTDGVTPVAEVGVYKDLSLTPEATNATFPLAGTARDDKAYKFGRVVVDGTILLPYVKILVSGFDFELTGVEVCGTVSSSKQAGET